MHDCEIELDDGRLIHGELWALDRWLWTIQLVGEQPIPLERVRRAVQRDARTTAASTGTDEDLLERAKRWGWKGRRA